MASEGNTSTRAEENERNKYEDEKSVTILQGSTSVVDRVSGFVDKHLTLFRALPIVIGGLGLVLVLRHLNQRMVSGWFYIGYILVFGLGF